jgi:uncharacterized protein YjbK
MSMPHQMSHEIEIKLNLGSFTNYLKLMGFLGRTEKEERHLNAFFDTEDRQLSMAGWALRVRAENHRGLITIKSIAKESGSAFIRQEVEAEISRSVALDILALQADVMDQPVLPVEYLIEKVGRLDVMILVKFENLRQKKFFRIADFNYLLEIDKIEFGDGSVDYELEVELPDISRLETVDDNLRRIFSSLAIPYEVQTESKFARALKRARVF